MFLSYQGLGGVVVPTALLASWATVTVATGQSFSSESILDLPPAGLMWMFALSALTLSAFMLASLPLRRWAEQGYQRFLERDASGLKILDDGRRWTMLMGPHAFMHIPVAVWGVIYASIALCYALDLF